MTAGKVVKQSYRVTILQLRTAYSKKRFRQPFFHIGERDSIVSTLDFIKFLSQPPTKQKVWGIQIVAQLCVSSDVGGWTYTAKSNQSVIMWTIRVTI